MAGVVIWGNAVLISFKSSKCKFLKKVFCFKNKPGTKIFQKTFYEVLH